MSFTQIFLRAFNNHHSNGYIHSLSSYYAPDAAMSNSTGKWLRVLITQKKEKVSLSLAIKEYTCYFDFCLTRSSKNWYWYCTCYWRLKKQLNNISTITIQMSHMKTICTFCWLRGLHPSQKCTVKLNYIANKSFMFLGTDEVEHLPKSANNAYMIINGNKDCTWIASNG